jgi:hypothetical protein
LARKELAHVNQPVRIFKGSGPDNDSLRAIGKRLLNRLPVSDPSANLHFSIRGAEDCLNFGGVAAPARHAIKVNYVQMAEAILSPRHRYAYRVWYPDYFLIIGTGCQLNACTTAQIEGGDGDHRALKALRARIMTAKLRR